MRHSKFNAAKTQRFGIKFASRAEADRYLWLRSREEAGEISCLTCQPEFMLQEGFTGSDGKRERAVKYRADFMYRENGTDVVEDVKGHRTPEYVIKRKLFKKRFPQYRFVEVQA